MHEAIGQLSSGKFYAYAHGYNAEPVVGTLVEVERALGLRRAPEVTAAQPAAKTYIVTLSFQYPAWDEKDGIEYQVHAGSKAEANASARRMAHNDGHLAGGKGRVTFTATEQ